MRLVLVYIGSALLAAFMAVWAKCTYHPRFNMVHALDMALASADFGGDVLFVIEAFEKGATTLAVTASILLGSAGIGSLCMCFHIIWYCYTARRENQGNGAGDMIDWTNAGNHNGVYAVIIIFSATNAELVKIYPWKGEGIYDGFPSKTLAYRVTCLALLEDVPQLILQLMFMLSVEATPVAVTSFIVTIVDLLWRVLKRTVKVMSVDAEAPVHPEPSFKMGGVRNRVHSASA